MAQQQESLNDRIYHSKTIPVWAKNLAGIHPPIGTYGGDASEEIFNPPERPEDMEGQGEDNYNVPPEETSLGGGQEVFDINSLPDAEPVENVEVFDINSLPDAPPMGQSAFMPHETLVIPIPENMFSLHAFVFNIEIDMANPDAVAHYLSDVAHLRSMGNGNIIVRHMSGIQGDPNQFGNVLGLHVLTGQGTFTEEWNIPLIQMSNLPAHTLQESLEYFVKIGLMTPDEQQDTWEQYKTLMQEHIAADDFFDTVPSDDRELYYPWLRGMDEVGARRTLHLLIDYRHRKPGYYTINYADLSPHDLGVYETTLCILPPGLPGGDPDQSFVLTSQVDGMGNVITTRKQQQILDQYRAFGLIGKAEAKLIMHGLFEGGHTVASMTEKQRKHLIERHVPRELGHGFTIDERLAMDPIGPDDGMLYRYQPQVWKIHEVDRVRGGVYRYGVLIPGSETMTEAQKLSCIERYGKFVAHRTKEDFSELYLTEALKKAIPKGLGYNSYFPDGQQIPYFIRVPGTHGLLLAIDYDEGHANLLPSDGLKITVRNVLRRAVIGVLKGE